MTAEHSGEQVIEPSTEPLNVPGFKIYKDKYIFSSTFLGGPLAGGYLIAENFRAFGDKKKYKITLLITVTGTLLFFTGLILLPEAEKIPNYIIPLLYSLIAFGITRSLQGKQIDSHIAQGGRIYSPWRAFLISIISLVITGVLFLLLFFALYPEDEIKTFDKKVGHVTHQIQYNATHVDQEEVAQLSDKLADIAYLDSTYSMTLFIDKDRKEIQIWVPLIQEAWKLPETIQQHQELKAILDQHYPENQITVNLCDTVWTVKKTIQ